MPAKGGKSSRNNMFSKKMGLDFKNVSGETVVICVLLVILLVLVIYYVKQNSEGFQDNAKKCELVVFFADWCPHCTNAKPVLETVKNTLPENVKVNIVNEKDTNARELMNKYNVRGFPTILLVKEGGEVVEFSERVNEESLNNFVANNAN